MTNLKDIVREELTESVENIFLKFQKELGITSGDMPIDKVMYFDNLQSNLAEQIAEILMIQEKNRIEIDVTYSEADDRTFIMENEYKDGEIKEIRCVGWYFGEPNDENTKHFKGKLVATYD